MSSLPYRPNVGVALFHGDGRVFLGRAMSSGPEVVWPGFEWQMPQGGIEPREDIVEAARRELLEETNVRSAEFLAATEEAWRYDFPPYHGPPHKLDRFRGQEQRWVAFRLAGSEAEIDVLNPAGGEKPEFTAWRWAALEEVAALVVPYKRPVYERVVTAFRQFSVSGTAG